MRSKYAITAILLGVLFSAFCMPANALLPDGGTPQSDIKKQWKQVYDLEKKGKPRSAMEIVNKIYEGAKAGKDEPQMLKALEYGIRLSSRFMEDHHIKGIATIEQEMEAFSPPSTQVLHSLLADLYIGYYQSHRHLILQRTTIAGQASDDMATWDQRTFAEKIFNELGLSLENEALLKNTAATDYSDILDDGDTVDIFRPTLFDILAHHALDFYKNDEFMSSRPAIRFEVDDPQMIDIAGSFVNLRLTEKEEYSMKFHALGLYQKLIAFHLDDEDPSALVDIDLNRLEFIYAHAIFDDKERLLLHTLEQMESLYMGHEAVSLVYYHIARHYNREGEKYNPLLSGEHARDRILAASYCENAIREFPGSYGAKHCEALLRQIMEKSLDCRMDYASLPGKHILGSLHFKNVQEIFIRIIPLDPAADRKHRARRNDDSKLIAYREIRPVKQWSAALPVDTDHHYHRTEIAIPPLTEGYYAMMISDDAAFEKSKGVISINNFWVTRLSYISSKEDNGDVNFYVLDREKGRQVAGVQVMAYEEYYDQQSRQYLLKEAGSYTSGKDGSFSIEATRGSSGRLSLEFINGNDRFISPDFFYVSRPHEQAERPVRKTHFFTDRAIYRPGQTIYFKGVLIESLGEKHEIVSNESTTVRFYDVNNQLISEQQLQTNEYGSFNGSFTAPLGKLTGFMRIQNESGQVRISVEEYRRPKFELVFDPVKGSYRLGSEVSVSGKAEAYAGNAIDHAMVRYRVVRNSYYPFRYYYMGYLPRSVEAEIESGETETDENGRFTIDFTAIPDRSQAMHLSPVFTYTVMVDVTDISGEVRSSQVSVSVSDKSLIIDPGIDGDVNRESLKAITLHTTNLNGEKEAREVSVSISRLSTPGRVLLKRDWERPDVYLIGKEDFEQWFPALPYKDEDDRSKWEETAKVYSGTMDTGKDSVLDIKDLPEWENGLYKLIASAEDAFGEKVEVTRFFTLYSPESGALPDMRPAAFIALDGQVEPGEKARFLVGSAYGDVRLLYNLEGRDGIREHKWMALDSEQKVIEIPVTEEDRGGLGISFAFISHNRSYTYSGIVQVPYSNKELDITFSSFRDRLLPGQDEEWNIRIRSHEGDKVAAEMLAAMYDASLDAFTPHEWWFRLYSGRYYQARWKAGNAFMQSSGTTFMDFPPLEAPPVRTYTHFDWKGKYTQQYYFGGMMVRGAGIKAMDGEMDDVTAAEESKSTEQENITGRGEDEIPPAPPEGQVDRGEVPVRKNLQETAFFFPDLKTNEDGDVIISFTMPEALTRWKMMGFAYTKDLSYGLVTRELVSQKELMVMPNPPRFFREGDEIWFSARVVNMSDKELQGKASLEILDAISMKVLNSDFMNTDNEKEFSVSEGNGAGLGWKLRVPDNAGPVLYRIIVTAGDFSDGEEDMVPVLKNRMLVTESLPLPVKGNETRSFTFSKLAGVKSKTLRHYNYTLEFTSNPAWYAVQALPYLMEYPHECSEQIFNRVYANAFASHIVDEHPAIKTVFESWKTDSPDAFLSKLEKNQDLKSALLQETPWVMQARNESERKKRIALLFDLNRMDRELSAALNKLEQNQMSNGGWPWFAGGRDNPYITQYIVGGMGKLSQLGILDKGDRQVISMVREGIRYMDKRMFEDFTRIKERHEDYRGSMHITRTQVQYLYARSFFMDEYYLLAKHKEAFLYFKGQAGKYWTEMNKYLQGMLALALHRLGDEEIPLSILASIKEHALYDDEMGMYWRKDAGYYWHEAPVETQALLIEAFEEVLNDGASVELMKTWLLKQKQTRGWESTRATADACYALLLRGTDLLAQQGEVSIKIGKETIDPGELDGTEKEAGTGYFRHSWPGSDIGPEMADITVSKSDEGIAWGAVYWQYFEDLDRITAHESPLSIRKKLFLRTYTEEGPVLTPIAEGDMLKPGDRVISRIEVRTDRDMEFVHMKDMRAAALEPELKLSGYRWESGLGYYESIGDAAVNFFFSYLPKGTWVFEYPLNVSQRGSFSNGISSIQCMYAPEFAAHSEGVKIVVE